MENPAPETITITLPKENLLLLLLEEKKDIMKARRAGLPLSSVPTISDRIQKKKNG